MSEEIKNFLDAVDENVKKEGGGGGYFGKIKLTFGYVAYPKGEGASANSMFEYNPTDEASRKAALAKYMSYVAEKGIEKAMQKTSCIILVYKDHIINKDPSTWKGDRVNAILTFTDAYKDIVRTKIKELGISTVPWEGWAHVAFMPDPSGRTRPFVNENGETEERVSLIAYIDKIYATKEDCKKAAEEFSGGGESVVSAAGVSINAKSGSYGQLPDGWTDAMVDSVKGDIKSAKEHGKTPAEIANDYGLTVGNIVAVLNS